MKIIILKTKPLNNTIRKVYLKIGEVNRLVKEIHKGYRDLQLESLKDPKVDAFYNIKKVETAKVFSGLDDLIDHLDLPTKKHGVTLVRNGKVTPRIRDVIRCYIDWMGRGCMESELQGYISIHSQSLKKLNRTYRFIINALIKGTEKGGIIEVREAYKFLHKKGNHTKHYRLTEKYFNRKKIIVDLKYKQYDAFSAMQKQNMKDIQHNDVGRMMMKASMSCTLPPIELIEEIAKKYIGTVNGKGKTYVDGKTYCEENNIEYKDFQKQEYREKLNVVDITRLVENHRDVLANGMRVPTASDTHDRVCDSICLMPKIFRKEVLIDEEELVEIDITALHPNIMSNTFKQYFFEEAETVSKLLDGDSHKNIADVLGVERNDIKKELLTYFNVKNRSMKKYKVDNIFKDLIPKSHRHMQLVKKRDHVEMSRRLMKAETRIMGSVVRAMDKAGIKCFVIYDAINVKKSDAFKAQDIMNDILIRSGLNTTAKITDKNGKKIKKD